MRGARLLAPLALLALAAGAHASIILLDSASSRYLKSSSRAVLVDRQLLSSVDAALTGLLPAARISAQDSQQIESIVQPSLLRKPRVLVSLSVAGLTAEDVQEVFGSRQSFTFETALEQTAEVVAGALADLQQANKNSKIVLLDEQVQDCATNCIAEHLVGAMSHASGSIKGSQVTFASGASLDLTRTPDKLYAVESAAFAAGVRSQLKALVSRGQEQDVIVASTLMGLQGLSLAFGAESPEVAASKEALKALLKWAVSELDAALDGDAMFQVAVFNGVPAAGNLEDVMAWKENTRRSLAAGASTTQTWPGENEPAMAKSFTAKACAYGGFILLVYFGLAGVYCMCYMPMQADTILFGTTKKDM